MFVTSAVREKDSLVVFDKDLLREAVVLSVTVLVRETVRSHEMDFDTVGEISSVCDGFVTDFVSETCIVTVREVEEVLRSSLTVKLLVMLSERD